jgi:hemolysin III
MKPPPWASRYTAGERRADRLVHLAGLVLGGTGAAILLTIAAHSAAAIFAASLVYSASLIAMLACSTLYHHHPTLAYRPFLRRLDHAAIFVLIAGTYTPFTVCRLHGMWAVGMTAAVWTGAVVGVAVKLVGPVRSAGLSTVAYIALGWIGVIGARPILNAVDPRSLVLVAAGGMVYSIGAGIHRRRSLRFHNAIWHAMVVIAASCQYAAILEGVVLKAS